ncbi:MAG: SagB family peptide dehydrogenase [Pseudomonadota bacterium]
MSGAGLRAVLRRDGYEGNVPAAIAARGLLGERQSKALQADLDGDGIGVDGLAPPVFDTVEHLGRVGLVALADEGGTARLEPVSESFALGADHDLNGRSTWKLSKFQYVQTENGTPTVRSPLGAAKVKVHAPEALSLLGRFAEPTTVKRALSHGDLGNRAAGFVDMLARAEVILPCDADGQTADDLHDDRRMWDFHELLYHSQSRMGRNGLRIGATWEFQDDIPKPPVLDTDKWADRPTIPLYRPMQLSRDLPLFEAMETRRSVRTYSPAPVAGWELGEFLWRTMRVRSLTNHDGFEMAARPYPNGGGIYEQELYVTIEACADLPRGFYHYDPVAHALRHISEPDDNMARLVDEAVSATAGLGRPQILFTIASRFGAFNWKYSSMCYAAQLKNVGVIYQTMYLVATAMGLGGCGLGLGNADRFAAMTGLDYETEGSIGEFMIGRPR